MMGFNGFPYCNNYLQGGFFSTGGITMFIFFLITIGLLIFFIYKFSKKELVRVETPVDILKKRYAIGEISKEEYENKKKDIL